MTKQEQELEKMASPTSESQTQHPASHMAEAQAASSPALNDAAAPVLGMQESMSTDSMQGMLNEQGDFNPEWYEKFEDLRPFAPSLKKFRRPEALAKSYATLERTKGYPSPDDKQRMKAFRRVVGLPESAEEYSMTRPEGAPDAIWDESLVQKLAAVAYDHGVPPSAMDAICSRYCEESGNFLDSCARKSDDELQEAELVLQRDWGWEYEDNLRSVASVLNYLGESAGVDVVHLSENPALRSNPDFAKLMLAASSLVSEAPMREGTRGDSRAEAHAIAHDPVHPLHEAYMRSNHPEHRYANEQYDRLAFGRG